MRKYIAFCDNKYLNYAFILMIFTSLLICIYAINTPNVASFARLAATLIFLQLLSFFIGSFFGFLFGFPAHNNVQFQDKYQRNSSLKEITSWLTKIIVGITLIELKDIFKYLNTFIVKLSFFLSGDSGQVFIIGCILGVFFIAGFMVFYILSVTTIFEELVRNDKNIDSILSNQLMNPNELNINNVLNSDFSKIKSEDKKEILKYVSKNGVNNLEPLLTKRLGKFLFAMKEYDSAANAYEIAYHKNPEDKYSLLNACFIRSKYLKDFENSNKKLKHFISQYPTFAPAYYNLSCNYFREYLEFHNAQANDYILQLKEKAKENLKKAFELDKGLYSEALKDPALTGMEIEEVFKDSKK